MSASSVSTTWSYPLRRYLRTAWLPGWIAFPIDDIQGPRIDPDGKARPWPKYKALWRINGERTLREIETLPLSELQRLTSGFMGDLPDITIEATAHADSGYLKLPNPDFIDLDDGDRHRLADDVGLKGELAQLVQDYVLCTLSETLRLRYRVRRSSPHAKRLLFRHYTNVQFPDAKWDILTLPGGIPDSNAMVVITMPPWSFGLKDFDDFTEPRRIPINSLDNFSSRDNTDILWAVLLDACTQTGCHYFAVTTYDTWVLGCFGRDYIVARTTPWFYAPVRYGEDGEDEFLEEPKPAGGAETGFMERLLYWAEAGRDSVEGCLPCEDKRASFFGVVASAIAGLLSG